MADRSPSEAVWVPTVGELYTAILLAPAIKGLSCWLHLPDMHQHLFEHIDIDLSAVHVPLDDGGDPQDATRAYEACVKEAGGSERQLLGIGENGHIGFNEHTSSLSSQTRLKTLTKSTRAANRRFLGTIGEGPNYALTVGIGTTLQSSECLLVTTAPIKRRLFCSLYD